MSQRASEAGFTLVELFVVIAIIALTATVSLPFVRRGGEADTLEAQTRIVAALLQETRSAALSLNTPQDFLMRIEDNSVRATDSGKIRLIPTSVGILFTSAKGLVESETAAIRFFPGGGSTGGAVTMSVGSKANYVRVSWLTGAIVVGRVGE